MVLIAGLDEVSKLRHVKRIRAVPNGSKELGPHDRILLAM